MDEEREVQVLVTLSTYGNAEQAEKLAVSIARAVHYGVRPGALVERVVAKPGMYVDGVWMIAKRTPVHFDAYEDDGHRFVPEHCTCRYEGARENVRRVALNAACRVHGLDGCTVESYLWLDEEQSRITLSTHPPQLSEAVAYLERMTAPLRLSSDDEERVAELLDNDPKRISWRPPEDVQRVIDNAETLARADENRRLGVHNFTGSDVDSFYVALDEQGRAVEVSKIGKPITDEYTGGRAVPWPVDGEVVHDIGTGATLPPTHNNDEGDADAE